MIGTTNYEVKYDKINFNELSKILNKYNIKNTYTKDEKTLTENKNSIIYVIKNKEIISLIGVNDIVRENAKEVIEELEKNDIETIMLTGDNEETARKIARYLGINQVISNVIPKEKREEILKLKKQNKFVSMCGDGINDAAALSTSDVGISFKTGTDIAMDSSDVILTKNDLKSIPELIKISKKTIKIIKENLFWAFFYNTLMIGVGVLKPIGISITPMIASLAMVFSSITVILNTLRLKKIKL